jgi:hypothetical protein
VYLSLSDSNTQKAPLHANPKTATEEIYNLVTEHRNRTGHSPKTIRVSQDLSECYEAELRSKSKHWKSGYYCGTRIISKDAPFRWTLPSLVDFNLLKKFFGFDKQKSDLGDDNKPAEFQFVLKQNGPTFQPRIIFTAPDKEAGTTCDGDPFES